MNNIALIGAALLRSTFSFDTLSTRFLYYYNFTWATFWAQDYFSWSIFIVWFYDFYWSCECTSSTVSQVWRLTNLFLAFSPGADPEDVILSAFKVLDPEGTGSIKKELWALSNIFKHSTHSSEIGWIQIWWLPSVCLSSPALRSSWPLSATGSPRTR